ncbi:MAG: hypothetical protein BWK80_48055 [Desulfobacteraceae bacterium IS3]|nr:MAG: hypothetical protein BWK80_48055 [Desulfobacteraceae bacterium IS3]
MAEQKVSRQAVSKDQFVKDRNVIVYEHLVIKERVLTSISAYLANPHNQDIQRAKDSALEGLINSVIVKYNQDDLKAHIKLIYLFVKEGMQGALGGMLLGPEQEKIVKEAFKRDFPGGFPTINVVGIEEMKAVLVRVQANNPELKLREFLLGSNDKGGYDTPKIAAAFIQLARRNYERLEMFIRLDDDVMPNAEGIKELKKVYYDLVNSTENKQFCFSWNYFATPLESCSADALNGPDYDKLFDHYVNSYSIRTTFLGDPTCLCRFNPKDYSLTCKEKPDTKCRLNIVHAKLFVDLFQKEKWGSDLRDPISGAGMCFSGDSLTVLPPWCNADEMISWIDDMGKYEIMRIYYGSSFDNKKAMLSAPDVPGFRQVRNKALEFNHGNVEWSVSTYLDRLLMGCILAFAINPGKYNSFHQGYGEVLKEADYPVALERWENRIKEPLMREAEEHIQTVLQDWYFYFCAKADFVMSGYIMEDIKLDGFVPVGGEHFFNAYVIKQLLLLKQNAFGLTRRVFKVLDKYLELRYVFWHHIVAGIDSDVQAYENFRKDQRQGFMEGRSGWLFAGLDELTPIPKTCGRRSLASVAFISREGKDGKTEWLLQWNKKWKVMNFISGHKEGTDANDLTCIIREIHEELFEPLSFEKLDDLQKSLGANNDRYERYNSAWQDDYILSVDIKKKMPLEYEDFSDSANRWTEYKMYVYDVKFRTDITVSRFHKDPFYTPPKRQTPRGPNEWVSEDDIKRGWTVMGRPISRTVGKILEKLNIINL